jgi:hypothetical protein
MWRWLGASRALLPTAAVASRLVAPALFPLSGGPVTLRGTPAPPSLRRVLASRTTEPSLGPIGQEPAFTPFEQTTVAARVPAARPGQGAGRLTLGREDGKLSGQAAGRWYFPPPLCADALVVTRRQPSGTHQSGYLAWLRGAISRGTGEKGEPKPRSTNRGMAQLALRKWLSDWPLLTGFRPLGTTPPAASRQWRSLGVVGRLPHRPVAVGHRAWGWDPLEQPAQSTGKWGRRAVARDVQLLVRALDVRRARGTAGTIGPDGSPLSRRLPLQSVGRGQELSHSRGRD